VSDIKSLFTPGTPVSIPLRPLNKGVVLSLPSNQIADEALLDAKNYIVGTGGLTRRPGLGIYSSSATLYPPVRDIITFWKTDGTQVTMIIDARFVYLSTNSGTTPKYDTFTTSAHLRVSGQYLIATNNPGWNTKLSQKDVVHLSYTSLNEMVVIANILSNKLISLDEPPTNTYTTKLDYKVYKSLKAVNPYFVDWTIVDNKVVMTDSVKSPRSFDGTTFGAWSGSVTFVPTCITFFKDRVWCGRIVSAGTDYRTRITWSRTLTHTDFTDRATSSSTFLDLPYSAGYIRRLVSMGSVLICYMTDAIWLLRPSQYAGDTLPLVPERIESGGIGLVGMKAVAPWLRGHFFIGDDNIYYLSNAGLEPIGTPVVKQTIKTCSNLWAAYVMPDPANNRVCFGFPGLSDGIEKIWSFDYIAKAWSYDQVSCSMIGLAELYTQYTWDTLNTSAGLTVQTWDTGMGVFASWDAIGGQGAGKKLYVGVSDLVYRYESTLSADATGNISASFTTKDFDFDFPDDKKTVYRVALKTNDLATSDLTFTVRGSTNKGGVWRNLGSFTIAAGDDEGHVDFRLTGSTMRFEFTSDSSSVPYTISEMTFRVKKRGSERIYGPED
jgi:hypothetical protein